MNYTLPTDGTVRHGDRVLAYYIFLDCVAFTLKREAFQIKIIEHLNKIVRDSVKDHGVHESQRVFLPTGDGICIVLINILEEPAIDLAARIDATFAAPRKLARRPVQQCVRRISPINWSRRL